VELIVVITILAILGTIAFISLQGYSQDAKNSKVSSDLGTLASAIEISNTKGVTTISSLLDPTKNAGTALPAWWTFGSGITLDATTGKIGWVDFVALNQNGADFKDASTTPRDYVYAYASSGSVSYYQLAGEILQTSWNSQVIIKGNYVEKITSDVDGLILWVAQTNGLVNNASDTISGY